MKHFTGFLVATVLFLSFVCMYQNRIIEKQHELIETILDGAEQGQGT